MKRSPCKLKPQNDQSSFWQTSPRHAVHGLRRTSLRSEELRLGRRLRPENDQSSFWQTSPRHASHRKRYDGFGGAARPHALTRRLLMGDPDFDRSPGHKPALSIQQIVSLSLITRYLPFLALVHIAARAPEIKPKK